MIFFDFETRGVVDLKKLGATRYATDPLTQVLCAAWQYDDEPGGPDSLVHLWHRGHAWEGGEKSLRPDELLERIASGELFEAHNAKFEYLIFNEVWRREFPEIDIPLKPENLRCSAAKASCLSLPRALGDAAKAVQLVNRKDPDGNRLINKLCKPIRRRNGSAGGAMWCEEEIEHRRNWKYCQQDVRTERELSEFCPEMTERELEYWFMDFHMNLRGITLDQEAATEAVGLCRQEADRLNAELRGLTEGAVEKGSQRIRFLKWINGEMVALGLSPLLNTKADTISFALYGVPTKAGDEAKQARKPEMDASWAKLGDRGTRLHRAFEICLEVNRSSVAKYRQMVASVCPDGRLHDTLLYNGADRTGRWCLTGDTEVLTNNGWVHLDKWSGGPIAQWHPDGDIVFADASRVSFEIDDVLIHIKGRYVDQQCTREHILPLFSRDKRYGQKFKPAVAGRLKKNTNLAMPLAGKLRKEFLPEAQTRAIVMMQGDGTVDSDGHCIVGVSKSRKIARCRRLLRDAGLQFSEYLDWSEYAQLTNRKPMTKFVVSEAPEWLRKAKNFGPELLDHNPEVFIDEIRFWDGHRAKVNGGTHYYTCSQNNASWVQTMAHLSGCIARIKPGRKRHKNWNVCYLVYILARGDSRLKSGWTFKQTKFVGSVFCAETETGFFLIRHAGKIQLTGNSGQGVQVHNFVRGYQADMGLPVLAEKDHPEFGYKLPVWDVLKSLDPDYITLLEGPVLPALAKACRGALIASPGKELYAADFKAIEARKAAWLSGCSKLLEIFRNGGDPYCETASAIYRREITKKDKAERQLGKVAVLGLSYAMGAEKFQQTVFLTEGIWLDDDFCKRIVNVYRKELYPEIPALWKAAEKAAITAVQSGGEWPAGGDELGVGFISYFVDGRFLHCRLPSGRLLAYLDPEVHTKVNYRFNAVNARGKPCKVTFPARMGVSMSRVKYHAQQQAMKQRKTLTGEEPESFLSPHLSFMGRNIVTKQWVRCGTHGGSLVENADQASSRDLLAEAMYRVDETGLFDLLLSIHDEVIAEAPVGTATVREFEEMVSEVPLWASGMPIEAEGWVGPRLRK